MTAKSARCPNPVCGNTFCLCNQVRSGRWIVYCQKCYASAGYLPTKEAALAAWARMGEWRNGGWRPIETAPKDGSAIIAACYGDKTSAPYYWENEPNHWGETGWQEEDARGGPKLWRHPSKLDVWVPLPEPPKDKGPVA